MTRGTWEAEKQGVDACFFGRPPMSTSLMYHAFGAKTYDYVKTEYREGAIHFHLR